MHPTILAFDPGDVEMSFIKALNPIMIAPKIAKAVDTLPQLDKVSTTRLWTT